MRTLALLVCLLGAAPGLAEEPSTRAGDFAERPTESEGLVDEDEEYARKEQTYAFNPVQARQELKVGNHYAKKGSYRAAAGRYLEATRWDAGFAEAYRRLGSAREELGQPEAALEAYRRYLEIEPNGKQARQVRERIGKLETGGEHAASGSQSRQPVAR